MDELLQGRRNRQRREYCPAPTRHRARELEREHWVSTRRLVDPGESRARDPHVEPGPDQMGERPEAQRPEAKLAEQRLVEGAREIEWIGPVAALRDEDSDRRSAEPPRSEREG